MFSNLVGGPSDCVATSWFGQSVSFQALNPTKRRNFVGVAARESASGTARVRLWKGQAKDDNDETRKLLSELVFAADERKERAAVPGGASVLEANDGVFVEIVSGSVDLTIYSVEG